VTSGGAFEISGAAFSVLGFVFEAFGGVSGVFFYMKESAISHSVAVWLHIMQYTGR